MSSNPSSLEAAARDAIGGEREAGALFGDRTDAQQLDMLRDADGKLPATVFRLQREAPEQHRKPGRPAGSRNKRNDDLAKLLAHKGYPDPVEFMASVYAMPIDQLCELLLIADGTIERRQKLDELLDGLSTRIRELLRESRSAGGETLQSIDRLAEACEALEKAAQTSQGKPGDLAIKALNVQLAAAKATAEYWHSKKPVKAEVDLKTDGVLVMPGAPQGSSFDALDDVTRAAGEGLAKLLKAGRIETQDIAGLKLIDGQLAYEDAEFVDVEDCGGDDA